MTEVFHVRALTPRTTLVAFEQHDGQTVYIDPRQISSVGCARPEDSIIDSTHRYVTLSGSPFGYYLKETPENREKLGIS